MRARLVILVLLCLLVACGQPSCKTQAQPYLAAMQPVMREFQDASTLANQTPRASLPAQIANLQAIQRKAEALEVPACTRPIQDAMVAGMAATVNGYLAFLAQHPEAEVQAAFTTSSQQFQLATEEMKKITDAP